MARMARAVTPGFSHHVTQRGNRRQQTFFNDEDYTAYLELMSEWCLKYQVEENHLLACVKYIELNPVRAGLVNDPEDWNWSSADLHINGVDDILVKSKRLIEMMDKPWKDFLSSDVQVSEIERFRKHERTGRPLGGNFFVIE